MSAKPVSHDALALLTADHNEIEKLGREFERTRKSLDTAAKGKLALRFSHFLLRHIAVKQEVLYPSARAVLDEATRDAVDKAAVALGELRRQVEAMESTSADHSEFDARMTALVTDACRSVKWEQEKIVPKLRHSRLDLVGIGELMAGRHAELATLPLDRDTIHTARRVMGGSQR